MPKSAKYLVIGATLLSLVVGGNACDNDKRGYGPRDIPITTTTTAPNTTEHPTTIPTTETPVLNQYQLFLRDNPEASEGFNPDEYALAEEHLRRTPEVMDDTEFYEAFNAEIKITEDLLRNIKCYPPSEADWEEIILKNWSDVYDRLYKNGEAYGPIAKSDLADRLAEEEHRENYYKGLWVPRWLHHCSPDTDWSEWMEHRISYVGTVPRGRDTVVYNLNNMEDLAENILQVYNEIDSRLHERAWFLLGAAIPIHAFPTSRATSNAYYDLYKENPETRITGFTHGLVISLHSEDAIGVDQILLKSLGIVVFEQRGPYAHGKVLNDVIGTHGEPAPVPSGETMDEIVSNHEYGTPIIYNGAIGWVPNIESAEKDGIPFVEYIMPDEVVIVRLDSNYDLSKKLELYKKASIEPHVIDIGDLK